MAVLKKGSKGGEVRALQEQLNALGFNIAVDGDFGKGTDEAVHLLQLCFGYDVDGMVGDGTKGLIERQTAKGWSVAAQDAVKTALQAQGKITEKGAVAGAPLVRTLKKGQEGPDVNYLQMRLQQLGYGLEADGKFGSGTEESVKALQTAFGYTVDGIVGEGTHTLLNAQIGYGWKQGDAANV